MMCPTPEGRTEAWEQEFQDPSSGWYRPPGDALLTNVHAFLGRFVAYPSEAAHVAHTLWIAHTWFMDSWESTPRIAFLSPEPGSGKSRALEVTEPLVPRPVHAINTTPAYLFRKVSDESGLPTILYDEIDTVFGPKAKDNEDIRGMLNAGHRRGAVAGRCVVKGKTVVTEDLPAYCAVAMAGLNDLPDTIFTRSVIIRMRRRAPTENVEPWRHRVNAPEADPIAKELARWAETSEIAWPEMPDGIEDRDADVWEALLAVADLAGGEWPKRARVAAVTHVTDSKAATPSLGVRLLADLRDIFGDQDAMGTETILKALRSIEDAPWSDLRGKELDARGLANRLRKYEITRSDVRVGEWHGKGYKREDLWDAWTRYVPTATAPNDETRTINTEDEVIEEEVMGSPGYGSGTSVTEATGKLADTCQDCGRQLMAPNSRQRGTCESCSRLWLLLAAPYRMGAMSDQPAKRANGAERHLAAAADGSSLARSAFRRGAKLASLPLGFAGRATLGLGKRLGGAPAEEVSEQLQQRAAEQLFRVLGELKGGAMKFGQALSLFESVLPDEVAAPYRAHLSRLQDAAPPMPTSRVHAVLTREFGADWRDSFSNFDPLPAAAASIGQVHRATWSDGRTVAVKVQYPGADEALRSDLRQIGRLSKVFAPLAGGMDVNALVDELTARVTEELDYTLEADSQQQAAEGFAGSKEFYVPLVLASTPRVMVSEWVDGAPLSSAAHLSAKKRNTAALRYVRFLFAGPSGVGLLHADPHPGNFKLMKDGRLGVVDFGLVARLPDGLPPAMGRILRIAQQGDAHRVAEGLREEGFVASDIDAEDLLDYLSPFVEPAAVPEFQFNRDWMREQFIRVRDPHASGGVAMKLNLPPSYLLIHRVWLGGLAVLSQLNAKAAFGEVLEEFLPGYAEE